MDLYEDDSSVIIVLCGSNVLLNVQKKWRDIRNVIQIIKRKKKLSESLHGCRFLAT